MDVQYEDVVVLPTPEGVELTYALGGLGSRLGAAAVDLVIRLLVFGAVLLLVYVIDPHLSDGVGIAIVSVLGFVLLFVYDVLFEVFGGGRTPGKRALGLRVVLDSGRPINFAASVVRNLVKFVDGPLTAYLLGIVSILVTRRNQRVGDLAGGTIVVRTVRDATASVSRIHPALEQDTRLDVSGVTPAELAAVREFLARREGLGHQARSELAMRLANGLGTKVGGLPTGTSMPAEQFLEAVAAAKGAWA